MPWANPIPWCDDFPKARDLLLHKYQTGKITAHAFATPNNFGDWALKPELSRQNPHSAPKAYSVRLRAYP